MAYSVIWDETTPSGSEVKSLGDNRIREFKSQIRERLLVPDGADYGPFIPSGTKMLFYQDTAPAGWTIQNTLDDKLVYVTKGSAAGGQGGGGAHSTGSWTRTDPCVVDTHILATSEMPAHAHVMSNYYVNVVSGTAGIAATQSGASGAYSTQSTGGGGGHTHTVSNPGTWRPAAYCFIICSRN